MLLNLDVHFSPASSLVLQNDTTSKVTRKETFQATRRDVSPVRTRAGRNGGKRSYFTSTIVNV